MTNAHRYTSLQDVVAAVGRQQAVLDSIGVATQRQQAALDAVANLSAGNVYRAATEAAKRDQAVLDSIAVAAQREQAVLDAAARFNAGNIYHAVTEAVHGRQAALDAAASFDAGNIYRAVMEAVQQHQAALDAAASFDAGNIYHAVTEAVQRRQAALDAATSQVYDQVTEAAKVQEIFRDAVTAVDFGRAYRDMVAPAIASGLGTDLDEGLDVAQSFAAILANLDAPPASDESTAEVARKLDESSAGGPTLPVAVRRAVAVYVGVLAFSLCAWFYVMYSQVANLAIDGATFITWSVAVACLVFKRLSGE